MTPQNPKTPKPQNPKENDGNYLINQNHTTIMYKTDFLSRNEVENYHKNQEKYN